MAVRTGSDDNFLFLSIEQGTPGEAEPSTFYVLRRLLD
jgi:hypothetical protein